MTMRSSPDTEGSKRRSSSACRACRRCAWRTSARRSARAYVIADNKLALNAGWDREMLAIELQALIDLDFDVELTGFAVAETEIILDEARERSPAGEDDAADDLPPLPDDGKAVTRPGDLWILGRHRLDCFAGSGTTVIAAEKCGRRARLVEFDPVYCDRIVRRFETFTGKQARLASSHE